MNKTNGPKIFVTCIDPHNNGQIHCGEWVSCNGDPQALKHDIQNLMNKLPSGVPQIYTIQDCAEFGGLRIDPNMDLESVSKLASLLSSHREAFLLFASKMTLEAAIDGFEKHFHGVFPDKPSFAQEMLDGDGRFDLVPDVLKSFIDLEKYANHLESSEGFYFSPITMGMLAVFRKPGLA